MSCSHIHFLYDKSSTDKDISFLWLNYILEEALLWSLLSKTREKISIIITTKSEQNEYIFKDKSIHDESENIPEIFDKNNQNEIIMLEKKEKKLLEENHRSVLQNPPGHKKKSTILFFAVDG